jgi:hypothetical protein
MDSCKIIESRFKHEEAFLVSYLRAFDEADEVVGISGARGGKHRTLSTHGRAHRRGVPRPHCQRRVALDPFTRSSAA